MSKDNLFNFFINKSIRKLSLAEKHIFEVFIFTSICQELTNYFRKQYTCSIISIREEHMKKVNITQELLKDILNSELYSLTGISIYTDIPEDILIDIIAGINTNPTFEACKKIFELHITVRQNLYNEIFTKIISTHRSNQNATYA